MTPCERHRENLAAHLYGELEAAESRALQAHLGVCASCREELRGLQRVANLLTDEVLFPHEKEVDWKAFSRATVQRATGFKVAAPRASGFLAWWAQVRHAPVWASAAAALLLAAGAAVGTWGVMSFRSPEQVPVLIQTTPAALQARLPQSMLSDLEASSAREGTQSYLSESRALLLSLLGPPISCDGSTIDIRDERVRSLDLIRRQRLIADDLERLPLARAREVCRDLSLFLMEVASLDDCVTAAQIRNLRDLAESRQLLLRIELLTDEMERGSATNV